LFLSSRLSRPSGFKNPLDSLTSSIQTAFLSVSGNVCVKSCTDSLIRSNRSLAIEYKRFSLCLGSCVLTHPGRNKQSRFLYLAFFLYAVMYCPLSCFSVRCLNRTPLSS